MLALYICHLRKLEFDVKNSPLPQYLNIFHRSQSLSRKLEEPVNILKFSKQAYLNESKDYV